jgi:hypothetical protein
LLKKGPHLFKKRAVVKEGTAFVEAAAWDDYWQIGACPEEAAAADLMWKEAGKCMKKWLNPVRSVVVRAHQACNDQCAASLDRIGEVIDAGEALSRRHETESVPATDKAALIHKVRVSITQTNPLWFTRHETESVPATDKAALIHKAWDRISTRYRQSRFDSQGEGFNHAVQEWQESNDSRSERVAFKAEVGK